MITDKNLKEWRDVIKGIAFKSLKGDGYISPYAFFLTDKGDKLGALLETDNPVIHRNIITSVCNVQEIHAYMVISTGNFILAEDLSINELMRQVEQAGSVGKHKESRTGVVFLFETRNVTRQSVYEYVKTDDSVVIDEEPAMDMVPLETSYGGVLNVGQNIATSLN